MASIISQGTKFVQSQIKDLVDRGSTDTLIFPNEMEQLGQFVTFSVFEDYQYQRDTSEKQKILQRIILPLPAALETGYNSEYINEEMGIVGNAAAQNGADLQFNMNSITDFLNKTKSSVTSSGALKSFGVQFAQSEAAPLVGALLGSALGGGGGGAAVTGITAGAQQAISGALAGKGTARNPHMAVLFKGVNFRTHSFTYRLIANNQKESDTIRGIIFSFKRAMAPAYESENHLFKYPQQFHIGFNKDKYLFKMNQSVLTSFNVNYHGEGAAFYHTVGDQEAPVNVTITLGFTETKIITKTEIDEDGA
jgi:hypothetical protein